MVLPALAGLGRTKTWYRVLPIDRVCGLLRTVLSGACSQAVALGILPHNPVPVVPAPRYDKHQAAPPDVSAVRLMLQIAGQDGDRTYPLLHLAVYTGMRRSEILALRWENVHLAERRTHVAEAAVKTPFRGLVTQQAQSVADVRDIDIDPATAQVLRRLRSDQLSGPVTGEDPPELVFPGGDGRTIRPSTV